MEVKIQTLILFKYVDTPKYYGEINVNAITETEAKEKLYKFISETGYIKENPSMLETMFNNFKLDNIKVIDAVII